MFETEVAETQAPWNLLQEGERSHRLVVLIGGDRVVIGAVVLSRDGAVLNTCPKTLLEAMVGELYEAQSREKSTGATLYTSS